MFLPDVPPCGAHSRAHILAGLSGVCLRVFLACFECSLCYMADTARYRGTCVGLIAPRSPLSFRFGPKPLEEGSQSFAREA